jgi:cephalosporin-C deacetylase-like acetyl esterase
MCSRRLTASLRGVSAPLFLLLFAAGSPCQETASRPGDAAIDKYLADETARLSKNYLDGAKTIDDWEKKRSRLQQEYLEMIGLWPLPEKTPLNAKVTGTVERGDVAIEKLHFQSRPGLYVTANLYRPKKPEGRLPAVLYLCGHSGKGRDGNKTAFQDHGMWFAQNGFVCLILDTLQLGEIPGIHHGTYREGRWWWQARGYTPAGVECWNGIRAIDYLYDRPEVDVDRIAATGISGGGAATIWIAAADERVKAAVPVSGMSDLQSYVSNKVINQHCDCMLMINTYRWEWTTIAALIAPRPMLFCNSDKDPIFPMEANRRIMTRLRQIYKLYGHPNYVDEVVSKGGHDYRPDLRVAIFKWMNTLMRGGDASTVQDIEFKITPENCKELRVFPEDKDIPSDAINNKIDETSVPKAQVRMPTVSNYAKWKHDRIRELRSKSFRAFPEQVPMADRADESKDGKPGATRSAKLTTESGIQVALRTLSPRGLDRARNGTLLVMNPGENWPDGDKPPDWVKNYTPGGYAVALLPRGVAAEWTRTSPPNYVARAHALLGLTVDEGRIWDIIATFRMLDDEAKGKRAWRIVGRGQAGILAAYAALLEPSIKEVVIVDPPASHRDGPIFLNVMRVLDIPEALGMVAPAQLSLVNAKDKAFDQTEQIYRTAGASGKLTRK